MSLWVTLVGQCDSFDIQPVGGKCLPKTVMTDRPWTQYSQKATNKHYVTFENCMHFAKEHCFGSAQALLDYVDEYGSLS